MSLPQGIKASLTAFAIFLLLAIVVMSPCLSRPGSLVCSGETGDTWIHLWAFSRAKLALSGGDYGWSESHLVTFPEVIREPIAVVDPLLSLLSVPLQLVTGSLTGTFNILVFLGILVTAGSGFLLGRRFSPSRRWSLGVLAGIIMAFNPLVFRQIAGGFTEYAWWGLFPLALYFTLQFLERKTIGTAAAAAAAVSLLLAMSFYCAAYFFITVAAMTLVEGARAAAGRNNRFRRVLEADVIVIVAAVPLLLVWFFQLSAVGFERTPIGEPFPLEGLEQAAARDSGEPGEGLSPDALTLPSAYRTLHGSLDVASLLQWPDGETLRQFGNSGDPDPFSRRFDSVFPAEWIPVLILAAAALFLGSARRAPLGWAALGLFFLLIALGPVPILGGEAIFSMRLPYAWFYQWVPGFSRLVIPGRAFFGTVLCLALLAVIGGESLHRRFAGVLKGPGALLLDGGLCLVTLIVFFTLGYGSTALPATSTAVPDYYRTLSEKGGEGALLELPLSGDVPRRMYFQSVHERPIFGGFFMSDEETGSGITAKETLFGLFRDAAVDEFSREEVGSSVMKFHSLGFSSVVIHRDGYGRAASWKDTLSRGEAFLGAPEYLDGELAAWSLWGEGEAGR